MTLVLVVALLVVLISVVGAMRRLLRDDWREH